MTSRDDIFLTINLMAEKPLSDDIVIVSRLASRGFDSLKAELLCAFVPLGLARAVIRRITPYPAIRLSKVVWIQHPEKKETFKVRLNRVAEFEAALEIGEETFKSGILSSEELEAVAGRSVELILINNALNAGARIENGRMAPPILLRLAEAPDFEGWYRQVNAKNKWWF
jgi:hypothetical protein